MAPRNWPLDARFHPMHNGSAGMGTLTTHVLGVRRPQGRTGACARGQHGSTVQRGRGPAPIAIAVERDSRTMVT